MKNTLKYMDKQLIKKFTDVKCHSKNIVRAGREKY